MMYRLGLVLVLAGAFGCSGRAVGVGGDGGVDCTALDEPSCRADSRCVAFSPCCCDGPVRCLPAGSSAPVCNVACTQNRCTDPCHGKDEASCRNLQGCVADYCTLCSCTPTYVGCRLAQDQHLPCPALGCAPPPGCGCDGLDEASCKAASSMGCTANYCPDCQGGTTWAGCTGPNEGAPACGQFCANQTCHGEADCASSGQTCVVPGQQLCGGACLMPPPCASDAECGGGSMICDLPTCSCTNTKTCTPGCTTAGDCGAGRVCDATHRCAPTPCGTCPPRFVCVGGGCERQSCVGDGDCGGGFCVEGQCYDTLGMCSFLPG